MDAVRAYEEVIKDNIEYCYLIQDRNIDRGMLDEIVSLMLETVCTRRKVIRIAGDDYTAELVKSQCRLLRNPSHTYFSHISFISMSCTYRLRKRTRKLIVLIIYICYNLRERKEVFP